MTTSINTVSKKTTWQKIAHRIRVPAGFAFAVIYLFVAHYTVTIASLGYSLILVVPGLMLRAYASGYVRKNAELTTTGPYAYTRNPLYLGSILIATGFGAASMNVWLVLALVLLFLAIYIPVIRGEEDYLRTHFSSFNDYAAHVPRLFPRITRYIPAVDVAVTTTEKSTAAPIANFSMARYLHHREYNAIMGSLGIYALLVLILRQTH